MNKFVASYSKQLGNDNKSCNKKGQFVSAYTIKSKKKVIDNYSRSNKNGFSSRLVVK